MPDMDTIPDVSLEIILSYLPHKSYLPIAHVSKRFRLCWLEVKGGRQGKRRIKNKERNEINGSDSPTSTIWATTEPYKNGIYIEEAVMTNPLQLGNLFQTPWTNPTPHSLSTTLLHYYYHTCHWNAPQYMRQVMLAAAARGDISSMDFLDSHGYYSLKDKEICTTAGAAGRLEALKWLREEKKCPWDAAEVYEESAENDFEDIVDYVERNCRKGEEIDRNYGGAC